MPSASLYLSSVSILLACLLFVMPSHGTPLPGLTKAVVKLDAYYKGQKIGSTNIPEGRAVTVLALTDSQYEVEVNESTRGWVNKEDIELLATPEPPSMPKVLQTEPLEPLSQQSKQTAPASELPANNDLIPRTPEYDGPKWPYSPDEHLEMKDSGNLVFLAIPFDKQDRTGICAGSSLLNIVDYMNNRYSLTQEEFFSLFNAGRRGATVKDMEWALNQVGFSPWPLYINARRAPKNEEKQELVAKMIDELNQGAPLSLLGSGHAYVIVGYNLPRKVFYAWDQNNEKQCPNVKKALPNAPKGVYEIAMDSITSKVDEINRIYGTYSYSGRGRFFDCPQIESEKIQIENTPKKGSNWRALPTRFTQKKGVSDEDYLEVAKSNLPTLIAGLVKANWQVAIPMTPYNPDVLREDQNEKTMFCINKVDETSVFLGTKYPEGEEIKLSKEELVELILSNRGRDKGARYWSFTQDPKKKK